jgi:hypothetical protein
MINTKLQNIIDTKSAIGNAIVNKGGTITSETPFYNYAAQIDNISTGGGAYSTFVAQDQDNAKYTVYTGYDSVTNPTPNLSNNFAFNRWLLNNSATGDIVLTNVVVEIGGTYNGANAAFTNETNLTFVSSSANLGQEIEQIITNNGFLYTPGPTVSKIYESNLVVDLSSNVYGPSVSAIAINNGFLFVGGAVLSGTNRGVTKLYENNLALTGANLNTSSTSNFGNAILSIVINNGFIYAGGQSVAGGRGIVKYREDNLSNLGNANLYGTNVFTMATNNGFVYAGGNQGTNAATSVNSTIKRWYEDNLAFVNNTAVYGGVIRSIAINDGFIYVGGQTANVVRKYREDNLALVGNTASYGGGIFSITTNNGFIYVGGSNGAGSTDTSQSNIRKYYESNLAFVSNTVNYGGVIGAVTTNNGFIYAGGANSTSDDIRIKQYREVGLTPDDQPFYNITTIKE